MQQYVEEAKNDFELWHWRCYINFLIKQTEPGTIYLWDLLPDTQTEYLSELFTPFSMRLYYISIATLVLENGGDNVHNISLISFYIEIWVLSRGTCVINFAEYGIFAKPHLFLLRVYTFCLRAVLLAIEAECRERMQKKSREEVT